LTGYITGSDRLTGYITGSDRLTGYITGSDRLTGYITGSDRLTGYITGSDDKHTMYIVFGPRVIGFNSFLFITQQQFKNLFHIKLQNTKSGT
jgi:hypothetical protein